MRANSRSASGCQVHHRFSARSRSPSSPGWTGQVHALDRRDPDGWRHWRRMISVRESPRSTATRYATDPLMDGYSVNEAAAVLGIPEGRVWELLARGVLAGSSEVGGDMRVFLRGAALVEAPQESGSNGSNGDGNGHGELSPFRELLTEFRNLTERYGQALLALGESRGEVASLRGRVDLLEARLDQRLPWSASTTAGWVAPEPEPEPESEAEPTRILESALPSEPELPSVSELPSVPEQGPEGEPERATVAETTAVWARSAPSRKAKQNQRRSWRRACRPSRSCSPSVSWSPSRSCRPFRSFLPCRNRVRKSRPIRTGSSRLNTPVEADAGTQAHPGARARAARADTRVQI